MGAEVQCQSLLPSHRLDEIWGETGDFLGTATSRPGTANIYTSIPITYTNQQPTNHLHHQLRTINHQPSTGRSKPQSTSWFLPDRSISSSPPGLWPWEESSDDGHQDGDFMDILWGFGQKWSLSHLIKINIV